MSAAIADMPVIESDRLSRLFAEHYRRVLLAAYRVLGNMADAEDIAQGVFLRLGEAQMPAIANAGSYLYRAALNGAFDLLRSRNPRQRWSRSTQPTASPTRGGAFRPRRMLPRAEMARWLRSAPR